MPRRENHNAPLDNLRIMVTRPRHQADSFCRMIKTAGGRPIRVPVIEINDPLHLDRLDRLIDRLSDFDIAIFVSANAVIRGLARIHGRGAHLSHLKLAAIGRKTAAALKEQGCQIDICPPREFTSEALLAMAPMQAIRGKRILIFRGEGGRELLAETLAARGATIAYAEVYRRMIPRAKARRLKQYIDQRAVDLITITSVEGLNNLNTLCGPAQRTILRKIPMVVGGARMLQAARALGFVEAISAGEPSDETMFDAVLSWALHRASDQAIPAS
jgi:uroporphyrinogen-III synthase